MVKSYTFATLTTLWSGSIVVRMLLLLIPWFEDFFPNSFLVLKVEYNLILFFIELTFALVVFRLGNFIDLWFSGIKDFKFLQL